MYKTDGIGEIRRIDFWAPICDGCVDFEPAVSKLIEDDIGTISMSIFCANKDLCRRKLERLNEMESNMFPVM